MIDTGIKSPEKIKYKPTEDHIAEMSRAMDCLCDRLMVDMDEFNREEFFEEFKKYIIGNNRLLYSNVSIVIFNHYDIVGSLQSNLESVITYSYLNCPEVKREKEQHERVRRALMKLWDHINLAIRQYELFNQSDAHYSSIAEEKLKDVEIRLTKEMNMQLISLIGIFTALSFIIFGGVSSLDNIFLGAKDIPVVKLVIVGLIWGFCIMNLVFVFMFFVAKLTKLNIKSTTDINANLVQKYPLIWWCNFVLISLLAISCWFFYLKNEEFSVGLYSILKQHGMIYSVGGTYVIVTLIIIAAYKIYKLSQK